MELYSNKGWVGMYRGHYMVKVSSHYRCPFIAGFLVRGCPLIRFSLADRFHWVFFYYNKYLLLFITNLHYIAKHTDSVIFKIILPAFCKITRRLCVLSNTKLYHRACLLDGSCLSETYT